MQRDNLCHMKKSGYMYILTNQRHTVFYTGVTSDLIQRIYQHKQDFVHGFTQKYNVHTLVYYEVYDLLTDAIEREKQIKAGSRQDKIRLVESMNKEWNDLYDEL